MPTEGQFIAIWEYDNKIWSGTFKWIGEKLFEYQEYFKHDEDSPIEFEDDFVKETWPRASHCFNSKTLYFTL